MENEFGARYLERYHHKPGSIPFVSNDLWEELDGNESVPVSTKMRFRHPKRILRKDWPDILKMVYDIEPNISYDPKVSGLILEITPEMLAKEIAEHEKSYRQPNYRFDSEEQREEFIKNMAKGMTPQNYIQGKQYGLRLEMMEQEETTIPGIKKIKQRFYEDLTDFEKRILQWEPEYGVLIDHRAKSKGLFPQGKDQDIKYEIEREYFFHLPTYPELFISLAQEINTNKAIWGLRRSMGLDWPFDSPTNERRPGGLSWTELEKRIHPDLKKHVEENWKRAGITYQKDNSSGNKNMEVESMVTEMNQFLLNLEQMLS